MIKKTAWGMLLLASCATAQATTCPSLPSPLSNGTTADASDVMNDLNNILGCANTNLAPIANPIFSGKVGIGVTPTHVLDVNGDSTFGGYLSVGSNSAPFNDEAGDITASRLFLGNRSTHSPEVVSDIYGSLTEITGSGAVASVKAVIAPTADSSNGTRALSMSASYKTLNNIAGSGATAPTAAWFENRVTTVGNMTQLTGLSSFGLWIPTAATALGTVAEVDAGYFTAVDSFGNTLASTITRAIGVRVTNSQKGSLVISTQAGIAVDPLTAGINNTSLLIGQTAVPTGNFGIYNATAYSNYFAGKLGIGTSAPTQALEVNGQVKVDTFGSATAAQVCQLAGVLSSCSSSIRYKEKIQHASFGLREVEKMQAVTFKWKGRDERDFGFVAEDVAKINPLFVTYKNNKIEGVKYSQLTAVLAKAIQEQQQEIRELMDAKEVQAKEIARLKAKVDEFGAHAIRTSAAQN